MISIITPTYNEANNITRLVREIGKAMKSLEYEIIVSDDDSPDKTADIAKRLSNEYPVRVLVRKTNKGLSPAVWNAFKIAKGEVLGVIDADLSHPPHIIPEMLSCMTNNAADLVVASRLIQGGGTEGWPAKRKLTSHVATLLCKPLTKVKDPLSGFFFLKKEVVSDMKLQTKGYKILLEILVKQNYNKLVEYPFVFRDRTAGKSKLNIKTQLQYVLQLIDLYKFSVLSSNKGG